MVATKVLIIFLFYLERHQPAVERLLSMMFHLVRNQWRILVLAEISDFLHFKKTYFYFFPVDYAET